MGDRSSGTPNVGMEVRGLPMISPTIFGFQGSVGFSVAFQWIRIKALRP